MYKPVVAIQHNNYPLKSNKQITVRDIDNNSYKLSYSHSVLLFHRGSRHIDIYAIRTRIVFTIGHNNIQSEQIITFILNNPHIETNPVTIYEIIAREYLKSIYFYSK